MRRSASLLPFLLCATLAGAQNTRMRHWYFGDHAGIDFSTGQPVVVNDGQLSSWEASATMSDPSGNLLFYTDGRTVWDRNHGIMSNGTLLLGDQSALKGVLIAPLPGSDRLYYILTTSTRFRHHVVDMALNSGNGAVLLKNQGDQTRTTESLAGTLHCNKEDYWIINRKWNEADPFANDTIHFQVRLLTASGLGPPAQQTFHFGPRYVTLYDHPTFSPSGSLFSYSSLTSSIFLFDFDRSTGTLSFRDSIQFENQPDSPSPEKVYSTEFSPDESKLYVVSWKQQAGWTFIAQYDLTAPDITATKVILDSIPIPPGIQYAWPAQGRLQLAPDGRIYASRFRSEGQYFVRDTIDAILHPNILGAGAGYQRDFLPLNGGHATCGLPAFISNYSLLDPGEPDCPLITSVAERNGPGLVIRPNPSNDHRFSVHLSGELIGSTRIRLWDPAGRLALEVVADGDPVVNVTADHLAPGLYIVTLESDQRTVAVRKLMLE